MIGDDVFDALAAGSRRHLLIELATHDPYHVPELSDGSLEVAEADEGLLRTHLAGSGTIPGVNDDLLRMHYVHLPKLVDYGFVEWDRDAHVVTKGPRFDDLRPILELLTDTREVRSDAVSVVSLQQ